LVSVCQNLDKKNFRLIVISLLPNGYLQPLIEEAGVVVMSIKRPPFLKIKWFIYLGLLIREIKSRKVDILHIYIGWNHFSEVIAGKLAGVKTIITTRRGFFTNQSYVQIIRRRIVNLFVNKIITNSNWMMKNTELQEKTNRNKLINVYNGLPENKFSYHQNINKKFIILFVGRLYRVKRVEDLVIAINLIRDDLGNFECLIVGEGNRKGIIEKLITDLDLKDRIKLLGKRDDIPFLLDRADVFVNCSQFECNSLAILEAMREGLPIIASENGGNNELVHNGVNGLLVPVGVPQEIANALLILKTNEVLRQKFGNRSRNIFMTNFTLKIMISKMEQIYNLISRPGN